MLLAFLIAITALQPSDPADYSKSYRVWIAHDRGGCAYWLTDTGMNSRQLADTLKHDGYEADRGAVILMSLDTPGRCVRDATKAIRQAGFNRVRARLGTEKDRMHGIP